MKKVSIVVPVYNKEDYIEECLNSLVCQTLLDVEIIVVDDFSQDNSYQIALEFQKKYPNQVKVYRNPVNSGIGKTRNYGLSVATGEYVGFVDGDDYVSSEMYEKYYSFAKENQLDLVTGNYTKIFPSKKEEIYNPYFSIGNIQSNPQILNFIDYGPCNKIFKKSILDSHQIWFEEQLKYEDMPFVAKVIYHSKRIGHINESYYNYRILKSSETTTMDARVFDMFHIMDIINDYYKNEKSLELEFLNINQITRYMLQQRYQKNKKLRNQFIEDGYQYLEKINPKWYSNPYFKKTSFLKRIVKVRKNVLKWYCAIYVRIHR